MSSATVRGKTTLEKYSFCDLLINKRYLASFAETMPLITLGLSKVIDELQVFDLKI
ncbi:hypothetical protein D3C78_34680 [compost metagenome]